MNDVYHYQYTDDWNKFNQTSLHGKEDFYRHLNMKNITDADYAPAKKVCKDFEIKYLEEYHDLYVQSYTLLLADLKTIEVFVLKYTNLILKKFLSASVLA